MALLQYRAPVKYSELKEIFKDFLQHFKSFESESADAIEDLRLNEDNDDEDELMDEDADGARGTGRTRPRDPKVKYMQTLQDIADREKNNIVIELDDLESVSAANFCVLLRWR